MLGKLRDLSFNRDGTINVTVTVGAEFAKSAEESDKTVIENLKNRLEELSREITKNENYSNFAAAQQAMDALMADVNGEIKFCITGERPSTCTHDCSSCAGCH